MTENVGADDLILSYRWIGVCLVAQFGEIGVGGGGMVAYLGGRKIFRAKRKFMLSEFVLSEHLYMKQKEILHGV